MGRRGRRKRKCDSSDDDRQWSEDDIDMSSSSTTSSKKPNTVTDDVELTSQHALAETIGGTQQGGPTAPSLPGPPVGPNSAGLSAQSLPAQERTQTRAPTRIR